MRCRTSQARARQPLRARSRGFSDEFVEHIFLFSLLHDIGKFGVPDREVLKPGKLDEEKWRLMARNTEAIERIREQFPQPPPG